MKLPSIKTLKEKYKSRSLNCPKCFKNTAVLHLTPETSEDTAEAWKACSSCGANEDIYIQDIEIMEPNYYKDNIEAQEVKKLLAYKKQAYENVKKSRKGDKKREVFTMEPVPSDFKQDLEKLSKLSNLSYGKLLSQLIKKELKNFEK